MRASRGRGRSLSDRLSLAAGAAVLLFFVWRLAGGGDPWLWGLGLLLAAAALWAVALWMLTWARDLRVRWTLARTDMRSIDAMPGVEFEGLVADLMRNNGYRRVALVGRSGDGGVDIRAETPDGRPCAVQCKRLKRPVQPNDVRAFLGVLVSSHSGYLGIFVASSGFTEQAAREAAGGMVLVGRAGLARWLTDDHPPDLPTGPS